MVILAVCNLNLNFPKEKGGSNEPENRCNTPSKPFCGVDDLTATCQSKTIYMCVQFQFTI